VHRLSPPDTGEIGVEALESEPPLRVPAARLDRRQRRGLASRSILAV